MKGHEQRSDRVLAARGMVARMGTLMVERRTADALAVAEFIAKELGEAEGLFEIPQLHRFFLNHATLLFRRGAPGDAQRARELVFRLVADPGVRHATENPEVTIRSDAALARSLPSVQLALNRVGQHRRAAELGRRLMTVHRPPHVRYHQAALNTSLCWNAEGVARWCGGDAEAAARALARGVALLEAEVQAGSTHVDDTTTATRTSAALLRVSSLLFARLWLSVVSNELSEEALNLQRAAANELLDQSKRNGEGPIAMMLRHGRLAEVLVEQASFCVRNDPERSAALAMGALSYYAPRWEIHRRDNDMTLTFVLRYAAACRLVGSDEDARLMLLRGQAHLGDRYGVAHPGLVKIRQRLLELAGTER
jgi:hypothetical protein